MEKLMIEFNAGIYVPKKLCGITPQGEADDADGCPEYCIDGCNRDCSICAIQESFNKLAEYEELEEQGLLLKLPCAVGDTVYAHCSEFGILEYEVDNIIIGKDITYQCSSYSEPIGDCPSECLDEIEPDISDFGKTVFITQAGAKEALKRTEKINAGSI